MAKEKKNKLKINKCWSKIRKADEVKALITSVKKGVNLISTKGME